MSGHTIRFTALILFSCFFFSCTVKTSRRKIDSPHLAKIHDIRIAEGLNKTIIEIEADEPLLYTSFRLSNPDRLVVEMAEVSLGQFGKDVKIEEGPIRAIHPSPSGELDVTRLEFELSGPVKTDIHPDGLSIVVEVTRREKIAETDQAARSKKPPTGRFTFFEEEQPPPIRSTPLPPLSEKGNQLAEVPVVKPLMPPLGVASSPLKAAKPGIKREKVSRKTPAMLAKKPMPQKKAAPLPPAQNVLSVRFEQGSLLRLIVQSDGKLAPRIFYSDRTQKHLVIDLPGVKSKRGYKQVAGEGQLVKRVRFGLHPDKLRMVLDFNQAVLHSSEQIRKELKITIQKRP